MKKSGGLWFWKLGRIGGSFYISKPKPRRERRHIAPITDIMWAALIGLPVGWLLAALFVGVM